MIKNMSLIFFSVILMSCERSPNDLKQMLQTIGIKTQIENISECTAKQIDSIGQQLYENQKYERLKSKLLEKNIKKVVLNDIEESKYSCEKAIIIQREQQTMNDYQCDPLTSTGNLEKLKPTQMRKKDKQVYLETNSQMESQIFVRHNIENLSKNELDAFIEVITKNNNQSSKYLSFEKINSLTVTFGINIMSRDYKDSTHCGPLIDLEEIIKSL
ncbi:MAG: hypothetical protein CME66_04330 [Halobacteriovoraceae bacterium]|nr:hypothetical protein [Halobacteriovoraceae bacterium]